MLDNRKVLSKGFTLIELLVVLAILALLATVILGSLNVARQKAQTSAIKAQVAEFSKLMALEYSETGSYAALNRGWTGTTVACSARGYTGNYATKAVDICNRLRDLIDTKTGNDVHTGVGGAGLSNVTHYAIMAKLPSGYYYCLGSSGRTSDVGTGGNGWVGTGCYANP